jgi:proteasome lid subunit RPN8/RPN11
MTIVDTITHLSIVSFVTHSCSCVIGVWRSLNTTLERLTAGRNVQLPGSLSRLLVVQVLERYPRKCFGYLIGESAAGPPVEFVMFNDNIRNNDEWRDEFESRGRYFVDHTDAGFVATPEESWRVQCYLDQRGLCEVAVFHTHRRHPGNFSEIDYDLHVSRFDSLWHLIISLRNPKMAQLRAFAVSRSGVREMDIEIVG